MAAVLDRGSLSKSAQLVDEEYTLQSDLLERLSASDAKTCAKLTKVLLAKQKDDAENTLTHYRSQLSTEGKVNEELKHKMNALTLAQADYETKLRMVEVENGRVRQLQRRLEVCEAHNGTLQSEKAGLTRELSSAQTQIKKLYKELQARKAQIKACRQPFKPTASITPTGLWEERAAAPGIPSRSKLITVTAPVLPKDSMRQGDVHTPPGRTAHCMEDEATLEVLLSTAVNPAESQQSTQRSNTPIEDKRSDTVAKQKKAERKVSAKSTVSKKSATSSNSNTAQRTTRNAEAKKTKSK